MPSFGSGVWKTSFTKFESGGERFVAMVSVDIVQTLQFPRPNFHACKQILYRQVICNCFTPVNVLLYCLKHWCKQGLIYQRKAILKACCKTIQGGVWNRDSHGLKNTRQEKFKKFVFTVNWLRYHNYTYRNDYLSVNNKQISRFVVSNMFVAWEP